MTQVTYTIDSTFLQSVIDIIAQGKYPNLRFIDVYAVMDELKNLPLTVLPKDTEKGPDSESPTPDLEEPSTPA